MRGLKIPLIIVIALSFGFGLAWGLKIQRDRAAQAGRITSSSILRVLTFKGLLSSPSIAAFESRTGIQVILTEATTPEELWAKVESADVAAPFDLISLLSYQIPLANQLARTQAIDSKRLKNFLTISSDFRDIPGEMSHRQVVPVLWGFTGMLIDTKASTDLPVDPAWDEVIQNPKFRGRVGLLNSTVDLLRLINLDDRGGESVDIVKKPLAKLIQSGIVIGQDFMSAASLFMRPDPLAVVQINHGETAFAPADSPDYRFVLPKDRASFWILSFALAREAKNEKSSYLFLDYLLEKNSAVELTRTSRQASTNKLVEETNLDLKLRPSYLRQVSLMKVLLLNDFSRSREIRALLPAGGPSTN